MGALFSLIFSGGKGTKISVILLAVLFAAFATFAVMEVIQIRGLNKQLSALVTDNATLKSNNQTLQENQKQLAQANEANFLTAKQLIAERAEAQAALDALAHSNKRDKESLAAISSKIDEMLKNPANNGPVAPVLRETIRGIQAERKIK